MKKSAGILFVLKAPVTRVLLVHATNAAWWSTWVPPKGVAEDGEEMAAAAIRETWEEVGIKIDPSQLDLANLMVVDYRKTSNPSIITKRNYIWVYPIESPEEIGLSSLILSRDQLQLEEVDEARFLDEEEAMKRVLPKFSTALFSVFEKFR